MKVVFNPLTGEFNLTAESSGASVSYPITPDKGGTGIANAAGSTLTLGAATTITGGGTVALGGFTLTVPATGTAALLATANVFTTTQMVDMGADAIELRLQSHSSKTTDRLTMENSAGTVVTKFDSVGRLNFIAGTAVPGNGNFIYYKTTGTTGLRIRSNFSIILEPYNVTDLWDFRSTGLSLNSPSGEALINLKGTNNSTDYSTLKAEQASLQGGGTNYALYVVHSAPGGADARSIYIKNTATSTSVYGLYIDNIAAGGTTNRYSIYSNAGLVSLLGSDTKASAAGATWKGIELRAATATITGSTNITTATGFNYFDIASPTLSAASALTVTNAATLYIANSPLGGGAGPATITNPYSIWIDAGISRFDGDGTHVFELPADATGNLTVATGRIPVKIGGATKYLRYYDD